MRCFNALYSRRGELGLNAEQARVLERYHIAFLRNGGGLPDETKARLAAVERRGLPGKHGITLSRSSIDCNSRRAAICGKRLFAPGSSAAKAAG